MHSIFLEGKRIYLAPLSREDNLDNYAAWINDQKITTFMECGKFPVVSESLKDYIDNYNKSST